MKPRRAPTTKMGPQRGQSFLLIIMFISLILLAILGVATDYTQVWAHRQMAQGAADAACQAAAANMYILAIDPTALPTAKTSWIGSAFDCSTQSGSAPCQYASLNGYTGSNVNVTFPTTLPGFTAPSGITVTYPFVEVTVTDPVPMSFTKLVSSQGTFSITAKAGCGLQALNMPIPLVVLNQTQPGTLSTNGGGSINIIGGPQRAVQVDSNSSSGPVNLVGSGNVDLTKAGPAGTGADFGLSASETKPSQVLTGTGTWLSPDLPYGDPFASYPLPSTSTVPITFAVPLGVNGCPDPNGCVEFTAGDYTGCSGSSNLVPSSTAANAMGCVVLPYKGSNPGFATGGANWQASHAYAKGAIIQPQHAGPCGTVNSGNYLYIATNAGTSGGTCPGSAAWVSTVCARQSDATCSGGTTAVDGSIVWQNVGTVVLNKLTTAIFDPGIYKLGSTGFQLTSGSTGRMSTANGDGSGGATFYFSNSGTVQISANSGSQSACTSASNTNTQSPNGCVVSYSVPGAISSAATGYVKSVALQCTGGPSNPAQLTPSTNPNGVYNGNMLFGPCTGTYAGSGTSGPTRGFLFFQNRASAAAPSLGGGAGFIFSGFMYFHFGNGSTCGTSTSCLSLSGNASGNSFALGDIAVDEISIGGTSAVNMILNPYQAFPLLKPQLLE